MESSHSPRLVRRHASLLGLFVVAALAARAPAEGRSSPVVHDELLSDRAELDLELQSDQSQPVLWLERAAIQRELHDWEGALADLGRARRAGASVADVALAAADVYLSRGDDSAAVRESSRALEHRPQDVDAHLIRARARMSLGLYQLASDDYGRALGLVPARPLDVVAALARALAASPEAGPSEAIRTLDEEIAARGPLASLVLQAVEYERELGRVKSALERLSALRASGWSAVQFHLLSGDVLADDGRREQAVVHWRAAQAALDLRPPRRRTTEGAIRDRDALVSRLGRTSR